MEQEEERKRNKLKKQKSFREVQESIQKFEHKKEFVEVKLKTSKSFREDKDALDKRFKRRNTGKMETDSVENGNEHNDTEEGDEVSSKLENIVVDVTHGIEKKSEHTNGGVINEGHVNNGYVSESPDINAASVNNNANERLTNVGKDRDSIRTNSVVNNESNTVRDHVPNGHIRGSMTPEPRLKAKGRLYEKNDKLTASNSNHLDRISLKGSKPLNHLTNAFGPVPVMLQEPKDLLLPAADVSGIPKDGSLRDFSVQQMVTIFRLLNVREEVVHRLFNNKIDGKRFSMFTDKDLKTLGMLNPIVCYFRDRSVQSPIRPPKFML